MYTGYCLSCQRRTGFRAHYGFIGTTLLLLLTSGLWLLALPFYPKRCVACGCCRPGWLRRLKYSWSGDPKPQPQIVVVESLMKEE